MGNLVLGYLGIGVAWAIVVELWGVVAAKINRKVDEYEDELADSILEGSSLKRISAILLVGVALRVLLWPLTIPATFVTWYCLFKYEFSSKE